MGYGARSWPPSAPVVTNWLLGIIMLMGGYIMQDQIWRVHALEHEIVDIKVEVGIISAKVVPPHEQEELRRQMRRALREEEQ